MMLVCLLPACVKYIHFKNRIKNYKIDYAVSNELRTITITDGDECVFVNTGKETEKN